MKIAHRNPVPNWFATPESDTVDADYEAEVQRATGRAEHEHKHAQDRLAAAERRLAKAAAQRSSAANRKRVTQLREAVGQRRAEVGQYARLMTTPVTSDKQIRLRTGLDDHLELGVHKPHIPRQIPAGPVKRTFATEDRRESDGKREIRGEG